MRGKAKGSDLGAARELREWVEIRKEDEARNKDKRLLELLSPELRDLIAEELNGGELPEGWATRCLVLGLAIAPQAD